MGIDISSITTNADQRLRTLFEDRIYANVISIVDQTIGHCADAIASPSSLPSMRAR